MHNILPDQDWVRYLGHADPDPAGPDRYLFQAKDTDDKLYFFPENFNMLSKILKIMTPLTLMRKIKHSKTAML